MKQTTKAKWAKGLAVVGLLLNMLGTTFVFIWGAPQPDFGEATLLAVTGPSEDQHAKDVRDLKRHYVKMSRTGLTVLFVGFACQLGSTMLL
jgi:hypothetical protein